MCKLSEHETLQTGEPIFQLAMLAQGSPFSGAVKLKVVREDETVDSEIVCLSLHTQVSFISFC